MTNEPPALDIDRLLTTLDHHRVDFLLVGGVAAIAYGARRPTGDLDCVAKAYFASVPAYRPTHRRHSS
jgi:hypothetical protein